MRVELEKVSKRFGRVQALREVDLEIASGSRVAVVGPNGSGKSTLMRILMGMLECEGDVRLDGRSPMRSRAELAPRMAYMPQVAPNLSATVRDVVGAVARLRALDREPVAETAKELGLDLESVDNRPFRDLSGGMRQKLLAALALSSRADLLILDEPTASMDTESRRRFFQLVREQEQRPTILLCSHRVEEIRNLVDRVVQMQDGHVRWEGPAGAYVGTNATDTLEVRAEDVVCRLEQWTEAS